MAVSLKLQHRVPVYFITFKSQHKIQNRWENTECAVEPQAYPEIPVYVVHPTDGEGHSHTLHRNYMLLINDNIENRDNMKSVSGVELYNSHTGAFAH